MANAILTKTVAPAAFTITIASLANGSARQSTLISNSGNYPAVIVSLKLTAGASAPTAGAVYETYLLRSNSTIADDAAGASDAAITIENAPLLGTHILTANASKSFYGKFDTSSLGPLGPTWGIAIKNSSGQTMSTTAGDHIANYEYYYPEVQ